MRALAAASQAAAAAAVAAAGAAEAEAEAGADPVVSPPDIVDSRSRLLPPTNTANMAAASSLTLVPRSTAILVSSHSLK